MSIDILLATYNSNNYLSSQLESIFNQSYKGFNLIISDDCSSDDTLKICERFQSQHSNITILTSDMNIGAKANFNKLIQYSNAGYVMFSDQDDVWLNDKISITMQAMESLENKHGNDTPLLVFTDKKIVDEQLNIIAPSSIKSEHFNTTNITLNRLLVQNIASGCTMMVNRALLDICDTIPKDAIMHDYWLMLVASAFGKTKYVDIATMLYRQHNSNEIGATSYNYRYIVDKLKKKSRANIQHNINQAKSFLSCYEDKLNEKTIKLLKDFIKLENASPIGYRVSIFKNKFFKSGIARNIGLLLRLKN